MTTRKVLLLAIALVLLIFVIWQQRQPPKAVVANVASVAVAKSDIPPYTILSATDLMTATVPVAEAANCFLESEMRDAIGMMTTTEMRAGNQINKANVLDVKANWPDDSTDDMLIGSFRVDTAHIIGGQLRPGHHIDLLATRPETSAQESESRWLARDIWVVGVYQSGGDDVVRPTIVLRSNPASPGETPAADSGGGLGLGGFADGSSSSLREGPANLVVVAVPRETARMISDYLGARLYSAWVYVRPGGNAVTKGRIDGLVFDDVDPDLMQQRGESGLDDVKIVVKTIKGVEVGNTRTASGGLFTFDNLSPGVYYVEETDPIGYKSLSTNRLRVELSAGQNLHVQFSDVAMPPATPTPEPTAINLPCDVRAYAAATQSGGAVTAFAHDADEVWVVVNWVDCDQAMPYAVTAYYVPEDGAIKNVASGKWGSRTGSTALQIKGWHGGRFSPGSYIAQVRVGEEDALAAIVSWTVEEPPAPLATAVVVSATEVPSPTPPLDITGSEPTTPEAVTEFGFGHGR